MRTCVNNVRVFGRPPAGFRLGLLRRPVDDPPPLPTNCLACRHRDRLGRRMIRGIARWRRRTGMGHLAGRALPAGAPAGFRRARGDGIIARVADRAMACYLAVPPASVVNVSSARIPGVHFPTVTADLRAAAGWPRAIFGPGVPPLRLLRAAGALVCRNSLSELCRKPCRDRPGVLAVSSPARGPASAWQRRQEDANNGSANCPSRSPS